MTITPSQLKGNWGEDYIASELAANDVFVRRVTQGRDTGIDLYCETIKDGEPFLHFWCQVKTSDKWSIDEEGVRPKEVTPDDITKHEDYWLSQPVPVFIFCVPDERDPPPPFYICSAFDYFIQRSKPQLMGLSEFLNEYLPMQTFLLDLKNGKVSSLKISPKPKHTLLYPSGFARSFEDKLKKSLIVTLWRLSQDIIFHGKPWREMFQRLPSLNDDDLKRFKEAEPYMKALEILTLEKEDLHYFTYATIGVYYAFNGDYSKSIDFYNKSLLCIEKDPDPEVDVSNPEWKKVIEDLNEQMEIVKKIEA